MPSIQLWALSVTSAQGPQNNALERQKKSILSYLSEQAQRAEAYGKGFILQEDLNSWLGSELLPGDTKPQNKNGKMFQSFLEENKLICANSLPFTKGLITRKRRYQGEIRQSTIDFYVVCERVLPYVSSMEIVDDKKHTLTNQSLLRKKNLRL